MDVVSDVLRVINFSGRVVFTARCAAPWALESPEPTWLDRALPDSGGCAIPFHALIEGRALVRAETWEVAMGPGDLILMPYGDKHTLHDGNARLSNLGELIAPPPWPAIPDVDLGGGGVPTRFLCGFFTCMNGVFNPLLAALPRVIVVRSRETPAGSLLEASVRYTVEELRSGRAGAECAITRLTELLFVEALRSHVAALPPDQVGWLVGLRDPVVGKALEAIHAEPMADWSLETLARRAGASRSLFAARFRELVGDAPMRYVARWRMQLAARALTTTDATIAVVAERFGYASEAAFHRAFRRFAGSPPAEWRRAVRAPSPVEAR